jgi:hypothetical protein
LTIATREHGSRDPAPPSEGGTASEADPRIPGSPAALIPPLYARNLDALRRAQPEPASLILDTPVPSGVSEATGRDGSPTFRLPDTTGSFQVWLGGSSMPLVSAEALVGGISGDGANLVLPGIQTGVEAMVLLRHAPSHVAVFVVEPDALLARLALALHDYAELIEQGRLVWIVGPEPDARLLDFFEAHPAYLFPTRLVPLPQCTAGHLRSLEQMLARVGGECTALQQQRASLLAAQIRRRGADQARLPAGRDGPRHEPPTLALFGGDARSGTLDHMARIRRGVESLGWGVGVCAADRPAQVHALARLGVIARVAPDLVLMVNGSWRGLRSLLPPSLPSASWFLPPDGTVAGEHTSAGDGHRSLVSAAVPCAGGGSAAPEAAAIATPSVRRLEVAADAVLFQPDDTDVLGEEAVVLGDLPSVAPASYGINLPSQIALVRAMTDVLRARPDPFTAALGDVLTEAEARCGITSAEESLRQHFRRLLESAIAPAVRAWAVVRRLRRKGVRVSMWGANWEEGLGAEASAANGLCRGAIPGSEAVGDVFRSARLVIPASGDAAGLQIALDAAAAGRLAIIPAPPGGLGAAYPGLADLTDVLPVFDGLDALDDLVGQLRSDDAVRAHAARLTEAVRTRHTIAHRLEEMRRWVAQS